LSEGNSRGFSCSKISSFFAAHCLAFAFARAIFCLIERAACFVRMLKSPRQNGGGCWHIFGIFQRSGAKSAVSVAVTDFLEFCKKAENFPIFYPFYFFSFSRNFFVK
jgi:hypothetical protein